MNTLDFFLLCCDMVNANDKANADGATNADKNLATNLFISVRAVCKLYEEQARAKKAKQKAMNELKTKLDLTQVKQ